MQLLGSEEVLPSFDLEVNDSNHFSYLIYSSQWENELRFILFIESQISGACHKQVPLAS
jgi:hypothetical protein